MRYKTQQSLDMERVERSPDLVSQGISAVSAYHLDLKETEPRGCGGNMNME